FPDGKRVLLQDEPPGQPTRVYVVSLDGGKPRPLTSPGLGLTAFGNPISPDGRLAALIDNQGKTFLVPVDGGAPTALAGIDEGEIPIQWSADGRAIFTYHGGGLPAKVWRLEIATGRKELLRELSPMDPAGGASSQTHCTP